MGRNNLRSQLLRHWGKSTIDCEDVNLNNYTRPPSRAWRWHFGRSCPYAKMTVGSFRAPDWFTHSDVDLNVFLLDLVPRQNMGQFLGHSVSSREKCTPVSCETVLAFLEEFGIPHLPCVPRLEKQSSQAPRPALSR